MPEQRPAASRLLGLYLRSYSVADLAEHLERDAGLAGACDWGALRALLEHLEVATLDEALALLAEPPRALAAMAPVGVLLFLRRFGLLVDSDRIGAVLASPGAGDLEPGLRDALHAHAGAHRELARGDAPRAIAILLEQLGRAPAATELSSIEAVYAACSLHLKLGEAYQQAGNFLAAHEHLHRALAHARTRGLHLHLACNRRLASLHWASGQFRKALELNLDPALREVATRTRNYIYLAQTHLNAAKCALDLQALEHARAELDQAQKVISGRIEELGPYPGYLLLYEGEILAREGHLERSFEVLQEAERFFAGLDPPLVPGVLDVHIAMVHVALLEKDHTTALDIVRKLLSDAERRGCLDARSRLLVLETSLRLAHDPALQEAYDNLVTRAHLINNPALLLRALADLFIHSVQHSDLQQQSYLYERILNLRQALERSCFADLYREYVRDRFAAAIEGRLRQHLKQHGLSLADLDLPDES